MSNNFKFSGESGDKTAYLFATIKPSKEVDFQKVISMIEPSGYINVVEKLEINGGPCTRINRYCDKLEVINRQILIRARYEIDSCAKMEQARHDANHLVDQICNILQLFEE